jgi:hypothetical protein
MALPLDNASKHRTTSRLYDLDGERMDTLHMYYRMHIYIYINWLYSSGPMTGNYHVYGSCVVTIDLLLPY